MASQEESSPIRRLSRSLAEAARHAAHFTSGKGLIDGFVNAYGALYKIPGVTVIGEVNQLTSHLMNIMWLFGTFTFAIVLGVVTEDIVATVVNIRSGNYPVVAQNHTLVLNWNSQTVPLLRQIAINKVERANRTYDGPVVVLAERDKEEMDKELRGALRGYALEWHTRMGAPHNLSDLSRVAAGQAKTVILLDPDDSEDVGKKQVAALLGVQTARASTRPRPFLKLMPQNFAVQAPQQVGDRGIWESAKAIMEASAQRFNLTDLSTRRDMSMLLAQSAVQPGVASVYCSIVQQTRKGVEFYIKGFPELEGMTYRSVRRSFDRAVICGVLKREGDLSVNPDDDDMFEEGDRLVALANTGFFTSSKEYADSMTFGEYEDQPDPVGTTPKAIVVAWWDEDITDLARSLSIFAPRGSVVKVISAEKPEGFPDEKSKLLAPGCRFTHVEGDPANADSLRKAGAAGAQAIIIGGLQARSAKESDALTISVILLLQEVLMNSSRERGFPAHIVGMVRQPETVEVANFLISRLGKSTVTAELMHPDELVSGILSQVAAEPEMARLLAGFIYSTEGQEIYLRRPSRYQLLEDVPMAFAEVAELCRKKCETAIGYITASGNLKLAPPAKEQIKYTKDDRIVVIANG
ncbi:hypothetical protein WJX73_006662 [Symbiochloris irregularis]|uniref:CASTOR/POLLUX/SYM8 ion channel conserved domain-containing protein n=1 Tax=Symbiochloris irregularis TaxID=706552 RepID=A0AAW1NU38_9CHLO